MQDSYEFVIAQIRHLKNNHKSAKKNAR